MLGVSGASPRAVALAQNFPNPVLGATRIDYAIPVAQRVRLGVFDVQGRAVRTLVDRLESPGLHRVEMSARGMRSGVYFLKLQVGAAVQQRKMLILR